MKDWLDAWTDYRHREEAILGGIPALFGLTYLLLVFTVAGELVALFVASIASSLLMLDALFLNPP